MLTSERKLNMLRKALMAFGALMVLYTLGVSLTACATPMERIPSKAEFERPVEDVMNDYPEFKALFLEHRREAGEAYRGMVYAEIFRETYGEPEHWKFSWWTLFPFNWPIAPQTLWYWTLGDQRLQARVDHPFYHGFEPVVCDLEWVAAEGAS